MWPIDFNASLYLRFRPTYPPALYESLVRAIPAPRSALDLGCGSGQATQSLLGFFPDTSILALDADPAMIADARVALGERAARVDFRVADLGSGALPADGGSIDLVQCASALHWFHSDALYAEIARVLRPGGSFFALEYQFPKARGANPGLDALVKARFNSAWKAPAQRPRGSLREIVRGFERYGTLAPLAVPAMVLEWDFEAYFGFLLSQSRYQHFEHALGADERAEYRRTLEAELRTAWGARGKLPLDFYLGAFLFRRRG